MLKESGWARLGDSLVNFIYSLSHSKAFKKPGGKKVSDKILKTACIASGIRDFFPSRLDRGEIGDIVESLILYAWLKDKISIETCVEVLESSLKRLEMNKEEDRAIDGFTALLNLIKEEICDELDEL